jgi:hypothetical protein
VFIGKEDFSMLNIITNKNDDVQEFNDSYFEFYTSMEKITEDDKRYIKDIDGSDFITADKIVTKFGETVLENISTGCKTMLNIVHHPEIIFSIVECGANVIDNIFELAKAEQSYTIYANRMILPSYFFLETPVMINGEKMNNTEEYVRWWEYGRD